MFARPNASTDSDQRAAAVRTPRSPHSADGRLERFSIRNTMRWSVRSVISTRSPVSPIKAGISITDNGSVQCTSSTSPGCNDFSAFRVFSAGKGHFKPERSSFVVVISKHLQHEGARQPGPFPALRLWIALHQACITQEADGLAGF